MILSHLSFFRFFMFPCSLQSHPGVFCSVSVNRVPFAARMLSIPLCSLSRIEFRSKQSHYVAPSRPSCGLCIHSRFALNGYVDSILVTKLIAQFLTRESRQRGRPEAIQIIEVTHSLYLILAHGDRTFLYSTSICLLFCQRNQKKLTVDV